MKRVLVTGATGFIGRNALAPLSERFEEVHAVSRRPPAAEEARVRWHSADLLKAGEIRSLLSRIRPTHLLHFAWEVEAGSFWTSPQNRRWADASVELFREFGARGGERAVGAGTCAEYDWSTGICSERQTPESPASSYGDSKLRVSRELDALARDAGFSAAWGRVFFLYGPRENPARLVASVILALLNGEPAATTRGDQIRDFLHVEDVAGAFVALLESAVEGPVNVGSGTPVAIRDLVLRIGQRLGREDLLALGTRPTPAAEPPLILADVGRLTREVLWSPRYTLESGLDHTIAWWKDPLRRGADSAR